LDHPREYLGHHEDGRKIGLTAGRKRRRHRDDVHDGRHWSIGSREVPAVDRSSEAGFQSGLVEREDLADAVDRMRIDVNPVNAQPARSEKGGGWQADIPEAEDANIR
jgi:hypothetical protein